MPLASVIASGSVRRSRVFVCLHQPEMMLDIYAYVCVFLCLQQLEAMASRPDGVSRRSQRGDRCQTSSDDIHSQIIGSGSRHNIAV